MDGKITTLVREEWIVPYYIDVTNLLREALTKVDQHSQHLTLEKDDELMYEVDIHITVQPRPKEV